MVAHKSYSSTQAAEAGELLCIPAQSRLQSKLLFKTMTKKKGKKKERTQREKKINNTKQTCKGKERMGSKAALGAFLASAQSLTGSQVSGVCVCWL